MTIDFDFKGVNADNLQEQLENIGGLLTEFFLSGLPGQLPDKVENFTTGLSEAFRIYGDIRQRLGAAIEAKDPVAASTAVNDARWFLEDTARFLKMSTSVDKFRLNSYIWAKKHCSPEAAAVMGTSAGTPDDYL